MTSTIDLVCAIQERICEDIVNHAVGCADERQEFLQDAMDGVVKNFTPHCETIEDMMKLDQAYIVSKMQEELAKIIDHKFDTGELKAINESIEIGVGKAFESEKADKH